MCNTNTLNTKLIRNLRCYDYSLTPAQQLHNCTGQRCCERASHLTGLSLGLEAEDG